MCALHIEKSGMMPWHLRGGPLCVLKHRTIHRKESKAFQDFITDSVLHRMFLMGSYQLFVACENNRVGRDDQSEERNAYFLIIRRGGLP